MSSKAQSVWQVQSAKNRFSEVIEQARLKGPQVVTRHGREAVVILAFDEYLALTGRKKPVQSFVEFLMNAPKMPRGLSMARSSDAGRKIHLR